METKGARPPPPNPAVPHREDCWSEGATAALIDAWGKRFVELDRGHLRQNNWQEVADAVNSRRTAVRRPPRTDVQCKNRVDTIKKKYKAERSRVADGEVSSWPFYDRIDYLIGDKAGPSSKKPTPPPDPPVGVPIPRLRGSPLPPPATAASRPAEPPQSLLRKGMYSVAAAAAAAARADVEVESESSRSEGSAKRRGEELDVEEEEEEYEEEDEAEAEAEGAGGVRELARAIVRFGEVYERVEVAKQKQMVELERKRMDFVKGLELQRMKMFVDSQVQLERIKRAKISTGTSASAGE